MFIPIKSVSNGVISENANDNDEFGFGEISSNNGTNPNDALTQPIVTPPTSDASLLDSNDELDINTPLDRNRNRNKN